MNILIYFLNFFKKSYNTSIVDLYLTIISIRLNTFSFNKKSHLLSNKQK